MKDTTNINDKNSNKFTTPLKPGDISVMYNRTRGKGPSHNGICNTIA